MAYNFNSDIEQDGKFIAAQIKAARRYESAAEEKAGTDLRKAADNWASVYRRLAEVRPKCKEAGMSFKDFKAQYCPDLGRTKLYKALAIADGRSTIEQDKERDAKRQAAKRARDEKVSVIPDVTDSLPAQDVKADDLSPAAQEQIARAKESQPAVSEAPTDDKTPEELSAELAEARDAIVRQDEIIKGMRSDLEHITDPTDSDDIAWHEASTEIEELRAEIERLKTPSPSAEPADDAPAEQQAGNDPLEEFKRAANKWLPMMTEDERRKARIHVSEWKPKAIRRKAA
jgi:hypothetical protein